MKPQRDIYQEVTDKIVAALESDLKGTWTRPWVGANLMMPRNLRGTTYRGINVMILWVTSMTKGYKSPVWATFKQWQEMGADMSKLTGEKGTQVIFWKRLELKDKMTGDFLVDGNGKNRCAMFARGYTVFNSNQLGLTLGEPDADRVSMVSVPAEVAAYIDNLKADIRHGQGSAFYRPSEDFIGLPDERDFIPTDGATATETYLATKAHEIGHWSGHKDRCNRLLASRFLEEPYAAEELIAELFASMFCARFGVSPTVREDHARYIKSWLTCLKGDKKAIFTASSMAQKALDFCDKLQPNTKVEEEELTEVAA